MSGPLLLWGVLVPPQDIEFHRGTFNAQLLHHWVSLLVGFAREGNSWLESVQLITNVTVHKNTNSSAERSKFYNGHLFGSWLSVLGSALLLSKQVNSLNSSIRIHVCLQLILGNITVQVCKVKSGRRRCNVLVSLDSSLGLIAVVSVVLVRLEGLLVHLVFRVSWWFDVVVLGALNNKVLSMKWKLLSLGVLESSLSSLRRGELYESSVRLLVENLDCIDISPNSKENEQLVASGLWREVVYQENFSSHTTLRESTIVLVSTVCLWRSSVGSRCWLLRISTIPTTVRIVLRVGLIIWCRVSAAVATHLMIVTTWLLLVATSLVVATLLATVLVLVASWEIVSGVVSRPVVVVLDSEIVNLGVVQLDTAIVEHFLSLNSRLCSCSILNTLELNEGLLNSTLARKASDLLNTIVAKVLLNVVDVEGETSVHNSAVQYSAWLLVVVRGLSLELLSLGPGDLCSAILDVHLSVLFQILQEFLGHFDTFETNESGVLVSQDYNIRAPVFILRNHSQNVLLSHIGWQLSQKQNLGWLQFASLFIVGCRWAL